MLSDSCKRVFSFLLALVMVLSVAPVQAFATEGEHDHEHECAHEYVDEVTAPGCETPGFTTWTCTLCGDSYVTDEVDALCHNFEAGTPVAATPEAQGYTPYVCTLCGREEKADLVDYVAPETEPVVTEPKVEEPVEEEPVEEEPVEDMPSELAVDAAARINALLAVYGITADMTDDQIGKAITAQPWSVNKPNIAEVNAIEAMAEEATEADEEYVLANADVETFNRFADIFKPMFAVAMAAATGTHTPIEGVTVGVSGATDNSMTDGAVTVTAQATKSWGSYKAKTATITVANSSESLAKISFSWTATSVNELNIDGTKYTGDSGTFEKTVAAGKPFTVTVTTGKNSTENKLVMSNFAIVEVPDKMNVSFEYDSAMGSITVDGKSVESGVPVEVSFSNGAELKASASGSTFLGWVDATNGKILSTAASFTLTPAEGMSVRAVFAKDGGAPWFGVGSASNSSKQVTNASDWKESLAAALLATSIDYKNISSPTHLFDNLSDAVKAGSYAVLMNNATLSAGTHTVPNGLTLLIPYDSANTLYTDEVLSTITYATPTAYRTLTMADGANLVVNGTLSISAQQMVASGDGAKTPYGGAPSGPVGMVKMQGSSNITVNGALYAYGYITGSGSVTANNGSSIYEMFQIADFRGGTQSVDMENRVFPISQYYIQNIEVPLTLNNGATEYAYTTIFMSAAAIGSAVAFISNSGSPMFKMESGSVTKEYDGSTDRLMVQANGSLSMSPIDMKVGTSSINSADYILGINGNITVEVNSGSNLTISQDIALLPGSQIIINEGATCKLNNTKSLYIYDADQWGTYTSHLNKKFWPVVYAPGKTYTRTESDLVDASVVVNGTVDASSGYVYTTSGGANVYSTGKGTAKLISGSETQTYQLIQGSGYVEIPITCAKLKNSDGSYFETSGFIATETQKHMLVKYDNGTWRHVCDGTNHVFGGTEERKDATCTEAGYLRGTCVDCGTEVNEPYAALGHTEVTDAAVAPTCETDGLTEGKHCSVCSAVIVAQEVDPKLGHKWNDGSITQQPTCTVDGVRTYTCQNDNSHEKTEAIPAKGHDMKEQSPVPATCTEGGYTPLYCANNCGLTEKNYTSEPLDHDWNITYSATDITQVGQLTAIRTCRRDSSHVESETVDVKSETTKEATCKVKGEITYTADFSVSWAEDKTVTVQTDTDPTKHATTVVVEGKAATCTESGLVECYQCTSGCKYLFRADTNEKVDSQPVIDSLGHDWGKAAYTWSETYYSCTATRACQRAGCGKTETLTQVADKKVTQEANCVDIEIGTAYVSFPEAYKDWAEDQSHHYEGSTDTTNHKTVVEYDAVESTCTEYGHEAGERCEACGENISGGAKYTELRPHSYKSVVTAPTCTEAGYTTYTCSYSGCQDSYRSDEVASLGHTPGEAVVENKVDPDCTTSGSYDSVVYCTVETCKAQISRETVTVDALGHTEEVIPAVAPTCTETGLTEGVKCSVCHAVITAQKVEDALKHDIVIDEAVAPTCTKTGLTQGQHCSRCDDETVAQEVVKATGHSYDKGVVTIPATCETAGERTFTCQNNGCNDSYTQPITALGHDPETHEGKLPTCTEIGWYQYTTCKRDGCEYSTYNEISATGHTYKTVVTPPTCTEKGYTTHTCNCGESYVDTYVEANGHKEGDKGQFDKVAATCTTDGSYVEVTYCGNCGSEMERENITVPALNHSFTNYVSNNDATCEEDGTKTAKCDRCDETDTVNDEGSAKGHTNGTPIVENEVAATCTAEGSYDSVVKCSICGEELSREKMTTEKAAHTPAEAVVENEVAATCTAEGSYDSVIKCSGCGTELSRTTEKVPATNHKDTTETIPGKAATCTESGLTDGKKCTACDEVLVKQEVIEATGHTYENGVCHCGDIEGVTVSGTVTSFNSETDAVTVELYAEGEETAAYSTTVTGNSATYSIEKVKAGTYTMKVSKANHVTREYAVTVEKEAVAQDVKIHLKGDITGDGAVNAMDNGRLLRHLKKTQLLSDYSFSLADINGDGTVNAMDDGMMLRHIKQTKLLW